MSRPDLHYTLQLVNHQSGDRLKIELIDLLFPGARSYRVRLMTNGRRSFPWPVRPWWQGSFGARY